MDFFFVFYITLNIKLIFIKSEEYSCDKLNSSIQQVNDYHQNVVQLSLNIYSSSAFEEINITCNHSFAFVDFIQIYSTQKLILDNSLNLTELRLPGKEKIIKIYVFNLVGININTVTFRFLASEKTYFYFFIDYSKIDLFLDGKTFIEADCQNFRDFGKNNFFTHMKILDFGFDVDFGRNKLCPHLFNKSQLTELSVFSHTNSFIKKNVFEFLEVNETIGKNIHLNEFRYFFIYIQFDTLNSRTMNQYVFKKNLIRP